MKALINLLEDEAQRSKARQTVTATRYRITQKNLFGWRTYIDEVLTDLVAYMMKTAFKYSVGAYITCGMQAAIDRCRYCNAKKRRQNYEAVSLDKCFNVEDIKQTIYKNALELYLAISTQYGADIAEALKPVIFAEETKVPASIRNKLKTPQFRSFLTMCASTT